jgi:Leucine-rich repeat (LRR) protein
MASLIDQISIVNDIPLGQLFFSEMRNNKGTLSFDDEEFTLESVGKVTLVNIRIRTIDSPPLPFTNLIYLNLSFNRISEIDGLSHLVALETLDVSHNKIFDLSPINKMISLVILRAENNLVENLKPISSCTMIKHLFLGNNNIQWEEIAYLESLKSLEVINIGKNPLEKKPRIFDFLCAFLPSLTLINGIQPEILLKITCENGTISCTNDNYYRINNDPANLSVNVDSDFIASRNHDFLRSSDGKIMMARVRAHSLRTVDKAENKISNDKESKEENRCKGTEDRVGRTASIRYDLPVSSKKKENRVKKLSKHQNAATKSGDTIDNAVSPF